MNELPKFNINGMPVTEYFADICKYVDVEQMSEAFDGLYLEDMSKFAEWLLHTLREVEVVYHSNEGKDHFTSMLEVVDFVKRNEMNKLIEAKEMEEGKEP